MSTLGKYAAKEQNRAKEFLRKYKNDPAAIARRFRAIARGTDDRSIIKYNILLSELNNVAGRDDVLADLYNNANIARNYINNAPFWNVRGWEMVRPVRHIYNLSALNKYKSSKAAPKAPKAPKAAPNNLTKNLKLQAKRLKIRVTNSVNGKRVPKSANKLRTQIQNALARR